MEFIVELLVEIFGNFLLGAVVSVFDGKRPGSTEQQIFRLIGFVVLGVAFGAAGAHFVPKLWLSDETLRVAWLLGAPLTSGLSVYLLHVVLFRTQHRVWPVAHAASLAFAMTLTRYLILA